MVSESCQMMYNPKQGGVGSGLSFHLKDSCWAFEAGRSSFVMTVRCAV